MTENSSRVAAARPADMEPLISFMVLAFAADPVARWMYRDRQRYLAYFGRFIRAFAGKAFSTGTAWCIDGNLGGALWLPPGVKPDEDAIAAILDESVPHDVMANVNTMFGEMAAYHPRDPHWYLPTIGIEPHLHRKGLGSALLTEALSRCDQEHKPAYLESSNPANMALYQRFGFETLGDIRAGHSPPMIPMLRGALWPALTRAIDVASHGIRRISTLDASLRLFRQGVSHVTEFPASEIVALRSSRSPNSRSA